MADLYNGMSLVADVRFDELRKVDFDQIVMTTDRYYIKPTISVAVSGEPYMSYGVFNAHTHMMEADSRQFPAAVQWARALERLESALEDDDPPTLINIPSPEGMIQ